MLHSLLPLLTHYGALHEGKSHISLGHYYIAVLYPIEKLYMHCMNEIYEN